MKNDKKRALRKAVAVLALFCMTTQSTFAALINLAQKPLFTGAPVPPKVLLTISKDQQLYKKAYNDYSDLDGDGQIETTYKHSIDYYGYFDAAKCYTYNSTQQRFEPVAMADADKLCTGQWSGNFLNWASMSRMDAVRKLLYGGLRSTDQTYASGGVNAETVLERAYLPTDAHAWAKYYNPSTPTTTDQPAINRLTPFDAPATPASGSQTTSSSFTIPTAGGDYDVTFSAKPAGVEVGDQIKLARTSSLTNYFLGTILSFSGTSNRTMRVRVHQAGISGTGSTTSWTLTNLSSTGISLCNLTPGSSSGNDSLSHTNTRAPLIRVARGNFALWNANERWQCQWSEERNNIQSGFPNGLRSNGNQAALSEFYASAENPSQSVHGVGTSPQGEYVARVQVCKPDLEGSERCKLYHDGNLKPIGLLQEYGDREQLHFGLLTGSHAKNTSGGVLRKNSGAIDDEVRTDTDGTFIQPYMPPNAPRGTSSTATPAGIINTLNYMRVYGYNYVDGSYVGTAGDNCTYQLTNIVENECTSWGNPMSEIFFEAVRYFAGKTATSAYTYSSSSKDNQLGLPVATWVDPLSSSLYCAPLNIVVMNASVSTNDADLGSQSATSIQGPSAVRTLTNTVGDAEGITNGTYFVGKMPSTTAGTAGYELCTGKTVTALGDVNGICPEGPTLAGSFHIAGLAHHAHTNRIRTDFTTVPASDTRSLKVTTYGIQLATNVPTLKIPVPGNAAKQVVIQPIYRLDLGSSGLGGGGLVDMKFVRQSTTATTSSGKVYVNWEDSEQGGDYDQDMWGTIEWVLDATANTIQITTSAISASTANPQGFGYSISGTTKDGPHFHSGIYGFNFTDPASGVLGCTNCDLPGASTGQRGPQTQTYALGTTTAGTLQDPLWYAAKYGSFTDSNSNGRPDVQGEWDTRLADGTPGPDGVPDTYFLVTNPLGLEAALDRAFQSIILSASLTSVAANSGALQTLTNVYQARFNTSDWSGGLVAYAVGADASIDPTPVFDAGLVINATPYTERTIITYNETAAVRDGVPFRWPAIPSSPTTNEISPALVTLLNKNPDTNSNDSRGSDRLKYLRGDTSRETGASAIFRQRPSTRLGDIVNSNPIFVGPPDAAIVDPTYATFRATYYNRPKMLYVGANDGMLHAFDASTGEEKLAYVPSKTFPYLTKLTSPSYAHRYYVDGTPEITDAQTGGQWRTVLVGGLAGGGQGLYALDVTNPNTFAESNARSIVMWEFTDADDRDLGYVYGKPIVRKMANGKWAAIVSGGYNNSESDAATSTTGHAYLYIIFLEGPTGPNRTWVAGTDYIKIDTGVGTTGTPNGLAPPVAADTTLDGAVDFVYAGDLLGNLWKFDVSSATPSDWQLTQSKLRLFTATDALGRVQPITAQAEGTLHPTGRGYVITFGTGKYLETTDVSSPFIVNSFYGIWDKNDKPGDIANQTYVTGRNQLLTQVVTNVTVDTQTYRVVTNNVPSWSQDTTPPTAGDSPTRHMGWLMDFPSSDTTGERSASRPILRNSRLIFTTITPGVTACSAGGSSFLMVVEPTTGARVDGAVLDTSGDHKLDSTDKIASGGTTVFASGVESKVGLSSTPTIVTGSVAGGVTPPGSMILGTTGQLQANSGILTSYAILSSYTVPSPNPIGLNNRSGRISWREVIRK